MLVPSVHLTPSLTTLLTRRRLGRVEWEVKGVGSVGSWFPCRYASVTIHLPRAAGGGAHGPGVCNESEVSRTRRYAERRGRMRRVQEPTRRSQTRAWGERNNILAYQVPLGISFFIYLMPWVFILYLMLRSFPRLRRPLPTLTPLVTEGEARRAAKP